MLEKIIDNFRLYGEKEDLDIVIERISKDVVFRGTNLWILVFAIFIASLGLNINSTAVIIGAMLISPLMGPIMGIGLGFGINDLQLVKKSVRNYTYAVIVGLITSFIYFSISPLSDAYSELLARTSPTIFDVLIALFGGLAGMLANSSKSKGNVIPGVAIATALMPPLCTAGYGLATMNFKYFFGAAYLFTINTVFIALATFATVKFLRFPVKQLEDPKADVRSHRIITAITLLTLIPSIYFGYIMIDQDRFSRNANLFVEANSSIAGNYLLNKKIDPQKKQITLVFGGKGISQIQISNMQSQLRLFKIDNAVLNIKQGISFQKYDKESDRISKFLGDQEIRINSLTNRLDRDSLRKSLSIQIYRELKSQYPEIVSAAISPMIENADSSSNESTLVLIKSRKNISIRNKRKIEELYKERMDKQNINLIFSKL